MILSGKPKLVGATPGDAGQSGALQLGLPVTEGLYPCTRISEKKVKSMARRIEMMKRLTMLSV
jgi:hypothetical protein